jgi:hypothetical protein
VTLLLVGCGAIALVLPGIRPARALKGHPVWFLRMDAAALALGLTSLVLGLGLAFAVGGLHLAAGSSLLWYEGHLAPGGMTASVLAAVLLLLMAGRLVVLAHRVRAGVRRARPDGWFGHHQQLDDHDLVVLPTAEPVAYGVDGCPPQIVVSQGLRDRLDDDLFGFVIDHERAHLRRHHRRYLLVAIVAEALLGRLTPVARSALALRLAVERAADEDAAGADRHRRHRVGTGLERLSADGVVAGCVPDALRYRAHRLLVAPAPRRANFELAAAAGLAALGVLTFAVVLHATGDVPSLLATLRR